MSACDHEEADSRICIHVQDAVRNGASKVLVRTVDTDVIVILVGIYFQLCDMYLGKILRYGWDLVLASITNATASTP